jgi:hypothetical protein
MVTFGVGVEVELLLDEEDSEELDEESDDEKCREESARVVRATGILDLAPRMLNLSWPMQSEKLPFNIIARCWRDRRFG